jgi:hypothetical protein
VPATRLKAEDMVRRCYKCGNLLVVVARIGTEDVRISRGTIIDLSGNMFCSYTCAKEWDKENEI